jgi:hypothetical protein
LIIRFIAAAALASLASTANAAPEDDYVTYRTAIAINHACGGLKYLEHAGILGAAQGALAHTTEYRLSGDGRMPQQEYDAWLAALDARAETQAQAAGCTQEAMQYIMRGKDVANQQIYKGLVLANYFAGALPTDIMVHVEVEPDRMKAMLAYDAYLQALYRENFGAFSARQKELAAKELPALNPFGGSDDFGMGLATALISPEDASRLSNAQSIAAYELNAVFFEVVAETAGFTVRPRMVQDTWTIPELRQATAAREPGFVVVDGPGYDLIDFDPQDDDHSLTKLFRVLTLTPDRGLRVMYYGDAAARLVNGTVRLYALSDPMPSGANVYDFFASPGFRAAATGYDGVRVETGCLSPACFDFPPAATDAFVAHQANQYAEIFVSSEADAQPLETDSMISKQGRVSNFYAYKLLRE